MAPSHGTSGAQGTTYEARVCLLLFVRGFIRGLKDFKLEYQVNDADKFDDVVFDDGTENYQIIQLKHKENEMKVPMKITHSQLFNEKFNTDFNLIKYVKAMLNANSTQRFKNKIKAAVVSTNINFDLIRDELSLIVNQRPAAKIWYDGVKSITLKPTLLDPIAIFDMPSSVPDAKYFKFTDDPNIVQILMRQAVTATLAKDVGPLTEDDTREALDKLIYAVQQPNVLEITDIIKNEMKNHFKLNDADTIYNILEKQFRDWCDTKNLLEQPSTSTQSNVPKQQVLTFADADKIFQRYVKQVSFGVTAPTAAFTGRVKELEKIKELLNKSHNLVVSQALKISGLGGIGKTQLTKQFIKLFGQSEFYGRVMWIEADNDETVKNSFEQLAQRLKIQDVSHKNIKVLIDEIFEYFDGLKVLFVFDNFHKSTKHGGDLVTYCWNTANGSIKSGRPYFLFTSRNRDCVPGVSSLDLEAFTPEEAIQLIVNELTEVNPTRTDAEKLANVLQYFPLALRQAIAYINEQHRRKQLFGKRYEIQDYLKKFSEEMQDSLDFQFPDDFGKSGKTVFITWNVTLDAIKSDKVNGENAIQVLQILAYLYSEKIDPKCFLPFFNNDDEKTGGALLLLETYSMITKVTQDKSTFYQIHRLVQAVVQLKFQDESAEIQERAFILINPDVYEKLASNYHNYDDYDDGAAYNFDDTYYIKKCSVDQILHNKTLSVPILKDNQLKPIFANFLRNLNDRALEKAALQDDDVEKIKALEKQNYQLKNFFIKNIRRLMHDKCNKIITYFIENNLVGANFQIKKYSSLIDCSVKEGNVEIFKYLIEKGVDFSEVLERASFELVSAIKNGKTDLLQKFINTIKIESHNLYRANTTKSSSDNSSSNPSDFLLRSSSSSDSENQSEIESNSDDDSIEDRSDFNQKILTEYLFFATIFNQESIVEILLENIVTEEDARKSNLKFKEWSLIEVAAIFGFKNLLEILLPFYDSKNLKECLTKLVKARYFSDKEAFEVICKVYFEKVLCLDDKDQIWEELSRNFNINKLDLAHLLLNNSISSLCGPEVPKNLRESLENSILSVEDKCRFDELNNRITFQNLTPDKFIDFSVHSLFRNDDWLADEYYGALFEKMVREIGDINVRNAKGETVLIKYLQRERTCEIETVKYLVEHGINVDAQDNREKTALRYAIHKFEIFEYLLEHVESVDENILEEAVKADREYSVHKLFEKHFSADFCFKDGKTLVEVAVESVSPKVVLLCKDEFKKYHEGGGDVNKQDYCGETLLTKLIDYLRLPYDRYDGDFDDVKFLVENGLDVDIEVIDSMDDSFNGYTALYNAATEEIKDIFLYLLENSKSVDEEALFKAITNNVLSNVEELPQNFNLDHILNMKTRLLECAYEYKILPISSVIDFLNQVEIEQKNRGSFNDLNYRILWDALKQDDVEKIKSIEISTDNLKLCVDSLTEGLLNENCIKGIMYFIENDYLGANNRINEKPLLEWSVEKHNIKLFKFLIEKGADLSEVLEFASVELISEIVKGEIVSLQTLINKKPKDHQAILNECLFFATIFNQESIVQVLAQNIDEPDLKYKNWSIIHVVIYLEFENILTILLQMSNKEQLKEYFIYLNSVPFVPDEKEFKIICENYTEKGGDVNYLNELLEEKLKYAQHSSFSDEQDDELGMAHILLDNGAYLNLSSNSSVRALRKFLSVQEDDDVSVENKRRFDELLNHLIFHIFSPDKFMSVAVRVIFQIDNWLTNEYNRNLFKKMVNEIGDINVRNEKGETLLIKYLKDGHCLYIETVKFLIEQRIDVEIQDNDGKSALYYALERGELKHFEYLLTKVKSVDEIVLEFAIKNNKELVQKLVENHFSTNYCFKNGKSLIEVAVESVSPKIVLLLKDEYKKYHERGGDVNKRDKEGRTLLINLIYGIKWMRYAGDFNDVKFLVENGVDVNFRDKDEHSALYYAAIFEQNEIFLYLLNQSELIDEEALFVAITRKVLSKVEELPQNFNFDHVLNMKTRLLEYTINNEKKKDYIINFLNELEIEHENKRLFSDQNNRILWEVVKHDDVEKIKGIEMSPENLKLFLKYSIEDLLKQNCTKVIKYSIENDFLGVNDPINETNLIEWSLEHRNVELFKFLIEKGADLSQVLEFASVELISEIIKGEIISLQTLINEKPKDYQAILNECLFYATICNQESIVKILLENIDEPELEYKNWSIIDVAIELKFFNMLAIILQTSNKEQLEEYLIQLMMDENFTDTEAFNVIRKKYLEKGGVDYHPKRILEIFSMEVSRSSNFNVSKLNLAQFLLDEATEVDLYNLEVLRNLFKSLQNDSLTFDHKRQIDELLNRIIFNNFTPDKFINILVKGIFEMENWLTKDYYRDLFQKMVRGIGDINVRKEKGETLLINYLKDVYWPNVEIVKFLVEQGLDVDIRDNDGHSVLYYAATIKTKDIFLYLLEKSKSVDEEDVLFEAITSNFLPKVRDLSHKFNLANILKMKTRLFDYNEGNDFIVDFLTEVETEHEIIRLINDPIYKILWEAVKHDDIEKIREIEVSADNLKLFLNYSFDSLMTENHNEVIKYSITNDYLGVNDRIKEKTLLEWSLKYDNVEFFKFLIEKGADLSEVLEFASVELISETVKGEIVSLQTLINKKPKDHQAILNECLFFATIFNQESIVQVLAQNINESNLKYKNWLLIDVAIKLKFENILAILLQVSGKKFIIQFIIDLWEDKHFTDKEAFKIICKKYLENCGVDFLNNILQEFLYNAIKHSHFIDEKLNLAHILLDEGADLDLSSYNGSKVLRRFLKKREEIVLSVDDKRRFDELLNRIIFHNLTPDKFMSVSVYCLFRIFNWLTRTTTYYRSLFKKMVKEIGGINVRNSKGETLLINYLKNETEKIEIENVEYLIKQGSDIDDVKDDEDKPALYYAIKDFEIFEYLLAKVKSVDEIVLETAIREDNKESVQKLLENHFPADFRFKNGKTLVEVAVESASPQVVLLLKDEFKRYHERGGDVNKRNSCGRTLLIQLMRYLCKYGKYPGNFEDARFFVENGLNVNIRDNLGLNALYYAAVNQKEIFLYLLNKSELIDEAALFLAITNNVLSKVEDLPQNFNFDHVLNMKTRLLEYTINNEKKKDYIINFLNELEIEHENKGLFSDQNNRILWEAVKHDDVEKIKGIEVSADNLKIFLNYSIDNPMNQIIKYSIENDYLGVNYRIKAKPLLEWSIYYQNVILFKFLIEKGADLSEVLESASVELISTIIKGETVSLRILIIENPENCQPILNECLFFATIFKQESVVQILLQNIDEPKLQYKRWSLICIAVKLKLNKILAILLKICDKQQLKECLIQLVKDENFTDKEAFQTIWKKHLEKGGDVNYLNEILQEFLYSATKHSHLNINKLNLAHILLDEGADLDLSSYNSSKVLKNLLDKREYGRLSVDDKRQIDELLNRIIFPNLTPDKFISFTVDSLFEMGNWLTNKYYENLFKKMVKEIGDINVRNEKGETLLIKYLKGEKEKIEIETVEYLVEQGLDVEAHDNDGIPALYYAVRDFYIFEYLLAEVKSVDENILEITIKRDYKALVQELLKKHFPVDFCFKNGKILIELAVESSSPKVVLLLKDEFKKYHDRSGDVNKRNPYGQTLLIQLIQYLCQYSRYFGNFDDVKFLVENGVDVDIRDNWGHTALYYAAIFEQNEIFLYLLNQSELIDEEALFVAITRKVLSKVEELPQNFDKNQILKIKTRLLEYANKNDQEKNFIIDFFCQLEIEHENKGLFSNQNNRILWEAVKHDDVEKIKGIEMSPDNLKLFLKYSIEDLLKQNCTKVIKYCIENDFLGVNDRIKEKTLTEWSIECRNVELFKVLIEKGADLSEVLQFASVELISTIIKGEPASLRILIIENPENCQAILNECLFFATIFNQESVVKILLQNIDEPELEYKSWSLICIAIELKLYNIFAILLEISDKEQLKGCLIQLVKDENFTDKKTFQIICKKYLEKGGDVNYLNEILNELLSYATKHSHLNIDKLNLAHILLDEGADLDLSNDGSKVLRNLLAKHEYGSLSDDDKCRFDELLNRIIFHNLTPDKFIDVSVYCLFLKYNLIINEYYRNLFQKMVREIGGINVRNAKGETLLIKYVGIVWANIETVKYLVEHEIDYEAQDNDEKSALYYSVWNFKIFEYLLARTESVDEDVLEVAIKRDYIASVQKLLENHFSVDFCFNNGKTLVEVAVEIAAPQVVLLLKDEFKKYLERGGDVNKRDPSGRTLLIQLMQYLCEYGENSNVNFDDVRFFVENGVDVDIRDNLGLTALFYAAENQKEIFLYLLNKSELVDEEALFVAITNHVLSKIEDLPQNFDKNQILQMKLKLIEHANKYEKSDIIDFLNQLEMEHEIN